MYCFFFSFYKLIINWISALVSKKTFLHSLQSQSQSFMRTNNRLEAHWCASLTFLSSRSTSVACSILCSRSSLWISRIHATRRTYGLRLFLRIIPGSLSDLSSSEVNKKSPPPLLSPSPGASFLCRLLLDHLLSRSRLLCLVSLEPMSLLAVSGRAAGSGGERGFHTVQPKHLTGTYCEVRRHASARRTTVLQKFPVRPVKASLLS